MATNNLMEERLKQILARKMQLLSAAEERLAEAQEEVKSFRREIQELHFVFGGTDEGGNESVARAEKPAPINGRKKKPRVANLALDWKPDDDRKIVAAFKAKGAAAGPDVARDLMPQFPKRSHGAIMQRIYRLVSRGELRRRPGFGRGIGKNTLEAA